MVNSGYSANLIMIAALKKYFGKNNENVIILSGFVFSIIVNPIIQNGLKPFYVNIDFQNLNWDLDLLSSKNTVAVISSSVLGNPYDIDKFISLIKQHKIKFIADNCDSMGIKSNNDFLKKRL